MTHQGQRTTDRNKKHKFSRGVQLAGMIQNSPSWLSESGVWHASPASRPVVLSPWVQFLLHKFRNQISKTKVYYFKWANNSQITIRDMVNTLTVLNTTQPTVSITQTFPITRAIVIRQASLNTVSINIGISPLAICWKRSKQEHISPAFSYQLLPHVTAKSSSLFVDPTADLNQELLQKLFP